MDSNSHLKVGPRVPDTLWDPALIKKHGVPRTKRGMERRRVGPVMSDTVSNRSRLRRRVHKTTASELSDLRARLTGSGRDKPLSSAALGDKSFKSQREHEFSQSKRPHSQYNTKWPHSQAQSHATLPPPQPQRSLAKHALSQSQPALRGAPHSEEHEADDEREHSEAMLRMTTKKSAGTRHFKSVMLRYEAEFRELYLRHGNKPAPFQERTELCFQLLDDMFDRLDASEDYQNICRSLRDELFASVFCADKDENLVAYYDLCRATRQESLRLAKDNLYLRREVAKLSDSAHESQRLRTALLTSEARLNDAQETMQSQAKLINDLTKAVHLSRKAIRENAIKIDNLL